MLGKRLNFYYVDLSNKLASSRSQPKFQRISIQEVGRYAILSFQLFIGNVIRLYPLYSIIGDWKRQSHIQHLTNAFDHRQNMILR